MPYILGIGIAFIAALYFTSDTVREGIQEGIDTVKTTANHAAIQKSMDLLQPDFRAKVYGYLADMHDAGIPLYVTETLRTPERQNAVYTAGSSKTLHSKHLAHDPDGLARAADTLPTDFIDTEAGNDKAVDDLQSSTAIALRAKWGLKNLPSIDDYGHLEDA